MFRDASKRQFACFAVQLLSSGLPSSSDMHTSPTTLSARRKCDQKQADRVTDQVEDSPPRVVVLFVSGPLVPDFRAVDIRFGLALTHSLTHSLKVQLYTNLNHGPTFPFELAKPDSFSMMNPQEHEPTHV